MITMVCPPSPRRKLEANDDGQGAALSIDVIEDHRSVLHPASLFPHTETLYALSNCDAFEGLLAVLGEIALRITYESGRDLMFTQLPEQQRTEHD